MSPDVSIIILAWNALDYTRACLQSVREHTPVGAGVQVIVLDNGSTDGTGAFLERQDWLTTIRSHANLGYARGCNLAIRAAPPQNDVLLLNNDIIVPQPSWVETLQAVAYSAQDIGIVGCRLVQPSGTLLHAGATVGSRTLVGEQIGSLEKDVNQFGADRDVPSVVGACMYIKRAALNDVGLLDESYFAYYEDTDYCLRAAEAGYRTVCAGGVTLVHHESASTRENDARSVALRRESRRTFARTWADRLKQRKGPAVLWHSSVGAGSGYAVSSRELVLRLHDLGMDVRLVNLYGTDWMDVERDDHRLAAMRRRPRDLSMPQVVYAPAEFFAKNSGRYRIGYTMLEVDGVPVDWVDLCNEMDEVWVPSTFNAETFAASGVRRPIHVMPLGVDRDHFNPLVRAYRPTAKYTFLSVFEWGERKAPECLVTAFGEAFSARDDVVLILKVSNDDPSIDVHQQLAAVAPRSDGPEVVLIENARLPTHQMGSLYRSADCFVLATRGEGWGMPILEALACGLPVIATGWGGQTQYFDGKLGYPVEYRLVPAESKCPYYRGFRWAEPSVDHLAAQMRYVYEHPAEARERGLAASDRVLSAWTWRQSAMRIRDRIEQVWTDAAAWQKPQVRGSSCA